MIEHARQEMPGQKLFDRNLAFLKEKFPYVWAWVKSQDLENTHTEIVWDNDQATNLRVNEDVLLYGENSKTYCANQMKDFKTNPKRIRYTNASHCNVSDISEGLYAYIAERVGQLDGVVYEDEPQTDIGFCFCFGLGLCDYIDDIIEETRARTFIFVEPEGEFFLHSLRVRDWQELYDRCQGQGRSFQFFVGLNPNQASIEILEYMREFGHTFLDGSYFFAHYPSWGVAETYKKISQELRIYSVSSGFYEDELKMIAHTYANLQSTSFRIIRRKQYLQQHMPVFIVAGGPSLKYDIENIKKWREHAFVISAGTTLNILLKNGIRPDVHVELENVPELEWVLGGMKEKYGFEGIQLVCASAVHPSVPKMFDKVWYFPRGVASSSHIFMSDYKPLDAVAPLSANAAAGIAAQMGFRTFYLFGVDCGRYVGASHHHEDSIYHEVGMSEDAFDLLYDREAPGNFGGKISLSLFQDLSRRGISDLAQTHKVSMYNCSHGARIENAVPLASGSISMTNPAGGQAVVLKSLEDQMKLFEEGEYFASFDFEPLRTMPDKFKKDLSEMLDGFKGTYDGFWEIDQGVDKFWHDNLYELGPILRIISGSFGSMVRLAAYFGTRINNSDVRRQYVDIFLDAYRTQCFWMADQLQGMFEDIADRKPAVRSWENYPSPYKDKEVAMMNASGKVEEAEGS